MKNMMTKNLTSMMNSNKKLDFTICFKCGNDENVYYEQRGPHLGMFCKVHGYIQWVKQPWQDFLMPIGKYKGKTMLWILENDKRYLEWMYTFSDMQKTIRDRVLEALRSVKNANALD